MGNQIILAVVATLGLLLSNADTRANSIFDRQNSQVDEIEVGCSLGSYFDEPAIKFSSGEGIVDGKNYGSTGTLSLIAKMRTKSGTWRKFSVKGQYVKIGNRLEITKSNNVRFDSNQITREEFKEIFGPLPELKCSAF